MYMNKKLLSLAVAGVLAGGIGIAQADVTVYGLAHVSIDKVKNTGNASSDNVVVASNSSRLGFKGSEDLGSGLKAIWQMENQLNMDNDNSSGAFSSRNRHVGLSGGFGTFIMGVQDSPFKSVGRSVELFPEYVGDARNLTSGGGDQAGWDQRPESSVMYSTPSMGGFGINVLYSAENGSSTSTPAGTTTTDNNDNRIYSLSGTYKGGPVSVGLGYEIHNVAPAIAGGDNEEGLRLAVSGTFGPARVVGLYQQVKNLSGAANADRTTYGVGAAFTFGGSVIKAQYYMADDLDSDTTGTSGAKMMAVGYDYNFSKTTTAYVAYAKTTNDDGATTTFQVNSGGHGDASTVAAGADPYVASIGMIVKF
jgi:predicted porin